MGKYIPWWLWQVSSISSSILHSQLQSRMVYRSLSSAPLAPIGWELGQDWGVRVCFLEDVWTSLVHIYNQLHVRDTSISRKCPAGNSACMHTLRPASTCFALSLLMKGLRYRRVAWMHLQIGKTWHYVYLEYLLGLGRNSLFIYLWVIDKRNELLERIAINQHTWCRRITSCINDVLGFTVISFNRSL